MIIQCKKCKNKFTLFQDEFKLEGQLINCKHCNEQWIYETKSKYLENRLATLDEDLIRTEIQLNEKKIKYNDHIENLQKDLKFKKEELLKQQILEEKVIEFEKRITNTEKTNNEQAQQEVKITAIENEIKETTNNISSKNKDIESKTNYIEMKINSYNDIKANTNIETEKIKVNDNSVVDLKVFDKENKKQNQLSENKKKKKFTFFSPGSIE